MPLKEEVRNRNNIFLEETNFPYRMMQKLWKLDKKWGRYGILKFPVFSENILCTVTYEYSNEWVDVIPSQFCTHLLTEMTKNSYFSHETVLLTPYPPKLNGKLCLFSHTSRQGYAFTRFFQKMKNFKISCIIYMTNCEGMTSPIHSFEYS